MADNKGMSDEKKARLEAIRAAKRAQGDGDAQPATAAAPAATIAPAILEAASPAQTPVGNVTAQAPAAAGSAAGASMSDDKKARLEAIRAANAAKQGTGGAAAPAAAPPTPAPGPARPAAAAPAAARPAAAAPAAPAAPRPAAARPTPKTAPIEDDRVPMGTLIRHAIIGAVFGAILFLMFATMTGNFIGAGIWGVLLGALGGVLVLNWPPERTTGE